MYLNSFGALQSKGTQVSNSSVPVQLKSGQVFHGSVKQLFPENTAEITIGGQRLIAKLEVPLKAGDTHFFQVTSTTPDIQLKVVTGPVNGSMTISQQIQLLADSLMLPKSKEMQLILSKIVNTSFPMSREQLLQAEQLMKNIPAHAQESGVNALKQMTEMKLQFQESIFRSLISGQSKVGMQSLINEFNQLVKADSTLNSESKLRLQNTIQQLSEPLKNETANVTLSKIIEVLTDDQRNVSEKIQLLNVLKQSGILPQSSTIGTWNTSILDNRTAPLSTDTVGGMLQKLTSSFPEDKLEAITRLKNFTEQTPLLSTTQKEQLLKTLSQIENSKSVQKPFVQQLHHQLLSIFAKQGQTIIFGKDPASLAQFDSLVGLNENARSLKENLLYNTRQSTQVPVQQIAVQAENTVLSNIDGKAFEVAIKSVLYSLGFNYESELTGKSSDVAKVTEQLKPQLVDILQSPSISQTVKESAELLLYRMNGLQMLSGEAGHQHQLLMQVPLQFFGKQIDATLQWNGRLKENGKIDSNYVRVLFYLQLDSLHETVVDMAVQNRVVTLTVYNADGELEKLVEPLKIALKEGLAKSNYQLSGVFVKNFEERNKGKIAGSSQSNIKTTKGVDIRI